MVLYATLGGGGTAGSLSANKDQLTQFTSNAYPLPIKTFELGRYGTVAFREVLVYNRTLSVEEEVKMKSYLL